jgi:phospholipid transport system transporter-binding protein
VRHTGGKCQLEDLGEGRFAVHGVLGFETVSGVFAAGKELFGDHAIIEVDFSDVERSDSAGLALLIEWVNWAKHYVREISYKNVPDQIRTIAQISEIEWILTAGARWTGST